MKAIYKNYYRLLDKRLFLRLYRRLHHHTMIPRKRFLDNLDVCGRFRRIEGSIVECGVYKGGMIAAMAALFGNQRKYHLFDSFQGLPNAQSIDGLKAIQFQSEKTHPFYFDNCRAEKKYAIEAMQIAEINNYEIHEGWFEETLPKFPRDEKIAVLRLDADWYASTLICLEHLYPLLSPNGLILIDDYYTWDGCTLAIHEYLSKHQIPHRIRQTSKGSCYIIKD